MTKYRKKILSLAVIAALGIVLSLVSAPMFHGSIQLLSISALAVVTLSSIEADARMQRDTIKRQRVILEQVTMIREISVGLTEKEKANELRLRQLGQQLNQAQASLTKFNEDQLKNELRLRQIGQISLGISKTLSQDRNEPVGRMVPESLPIVSNDVAAVSSAFLKNRILMDLDSIKNALHCNSSQNAAQRASTDSEKTAVRSGEHD